MSPMLQFVLTALLLFLSSASLAAESQFWISVGSFKTELKAAKTAQAYEEKYPEKFSVVGSDTNRGFFYRVALGPYASKEMARESQNRIRGLGFSAVWIFLEDPATLSSNSVPRNDFSDDLYKELENYKNKYDLDLDLSMPLEGPSTDRTTNESPEKLDAVPTEPPEGYQLNKLRRDAQAAATGQDYIAMTRVVDSSIYEEFEEEAHELTADDFVLEIEQGKPIRLKRHDNQVHEVRIDGYLDELAWKDIPGVEQFIVSDPDTLETPRYRTVVKAFYTDKGLYVSFDMEQPPETLVKRYSGRDNGWINRDAVSITLDTSGEGRYGYWMNLALGGNQTDGTVLAEREFSEDWDGAWLGETKMTEAGWSAELYLPWSQVAMPQRDKERVINAYVSRKVAHLDERWTIPALPRSQPFFMSSLQPLVLESVNPRKQWSFFPYATVSKDKVDQEVDPRLGGDFFYRPSTNFQITGTLNPDFGNVESDEAIVNLSAFETFFPEKRLFFKEGIEVFKTSSKKSASVLHTRRIGGRPRAPELPEGIELSSRQLGSPLDLDAALKVVGSMGKLRYGILGASEDDVVFDVDDLTISQDGSDYGVARFLYENKSEKGVYQGVGFISTLSEHPEENAYVQGLDYHFLSSQGKWKADGQIFYSDTDEEGSGLGGYADLTYRPSRRMQVNFSASHYDDQLDLNDLGFLRRNDVTNFWMQAEYRRYDFDWARKIYLNSFLSYEVNGDGEKTNKEIGGRTGIDFNNRHEVRWDIAYKPERIDDRDSRGNGSYIKKQHHRTSFEYRTDSSKRLYNRIRMNYSKESQGGERYVFRNSVNWRPVDQLGIGLSAQYEDSNAWVLWQEGGRFTSFDTKQWRPNVNFSYFLSAKQQLRLSAQWVGIKARERRFYGLETKSKRLVEEEKSGSVPDDFAISSLALQFRYQWEIAPLSELFLVYTLNGYQSVAESSFGDLLDSAYQNPSNEDIVLKLRYRLGT